MLHELVAHYVRSVPITDVMTYLRRVCAFDRYQASWGIEHAAEYVAETARAIGLADVKIERFSASGEAHWWTFRAPVSWTPTAARLEVRVGGVRVLEIDHAQQPFSIAAYSAPTPAGGVNARLVAVPTLDTVPEVEGAIAVVGRSAFLSPALISDLTARGALGFVTDARPYGQWLEPAHPGRIELDPNTDLFAFSVTSQQLEHLQRWIDQGARAHVIVDVDRSAAMPVVTGILPGAHSNKEVWLIAHLCHPRPGANDNGSGVAALLGIGKAHVLSRQADASRGTDHTIRFVWGPEFVGTAAMLHRRLSRFGRAGLPLAVVNLDMVGEDQSLCGGEFIVERNPDCLPSAIASIAEFVVGQVFDLTRAVNGSWRKSPFLGFSDHALFVDPQIKCAAVQFCHGPDRFNHTAGDSLDKVSPFEMLRATAAGAALVTILASEGATLRSAVGRILRDWCVAEETAARLTARHTDATSSSKAWGERLVCYVRERNAMLLSLWDGTQKNGPDLQHKRAWSRSKGGRALEGRWSGPLNIRAMMADLSAESRSTLLGLIRADKNHYAHLFNFAIRADGRHSRVDVIDETAFAFGRPIDPNVANRLVDALLESGWVT